MSNDIQIRSRLRHRYSTLQISERPDIGVLESGVLRDLSTIHRIGRVNVRPTRAETRRHNRNQRIKDSIDIERLAENIRIAVELILPDLIRHHEYRRRARPG